MPDDLDQLNGWIEASYDHCFRTACLIVGNRADAEEAVQEAFLRAWRFRRSLESAERARPWLFRVVVNSCHSKLRQEIPRRQRDADGHELDELEAPSADPADLVVDGERATAVVAALLGLPVHLRVVVVLRYYADLSEREIARAIGRRPGTVKSRLHEARRRLAEAPELRTLAGEQSAEQEQDPTNTDCEEAAQ